VGSLEQHRQTLAVGWPQLDLNWPVAKLHTSSFGMLHLNPWMASQQSKSTDWTFHGWALEGRVLCLHLSCGCNLARTTWCVAHGWSGHALLNIPDVPHLRDNSAAMGGDLDKLDIAVVMCLCYPSWAQALVSVMFALCANFDCYNVSHIVCVWSPFSVFTLVVLKDKLLLSFLDKLSGCLEWGIQHCVTTKHLLCRHFTRSVVCCWIHSFLTCCQHTLKSKEWIKTRFDFDLCTWNHVVECLVRSFHHGIWLGVSAGNDLTQQWACVQCHVQI